MFLSRVEDEANAIIGLVKIQRLKRTYINVKNPKINTVLQQNILYRIFRICASPSCKNRRDLAYLLAVPFEAVNIWFKKVRKLEDTSDKELKKITSLQIVRIYLTEAAKLKK